MRFKSILHATVTSMAAVTLSACASPGPTVRSHAAAHLPVPGESYFVVPARTDLETADFTRYAALADEALRARGFVRAANPQSAALVVKVDFGIARAERRVMVRDALAPFRNHMDSSNASGPPSPRLPPADLPQTRSAETRYDFVEVGIVRGSDTAILYEGIATERVKPAKERPLDHLIQAIFAQWLPATDATT